MKDCFDKINCEFLCDIEETQSKITPYSYTKSCLIASQKENSVVPTTRKNCESCISCDRPKSYNTHVSALVNLNRQERILNGEEIELGDRSYMPSYVYQTSGDAVEKTGVGTELKRLIPQQLAHKGCGCNDYAKKMDSWGIEGCKARTDEIVDRLVKKSKETKIFGWVPETATKAVAKKLLETAIQRAEKKYVHQKVNWFVALTTAPRPECTLNQCVESLFVAGFKPVVFAEPGSTRIRGLTTIENEERKGVWHNWLDSCVYALENSDADVIMTVQDDALFHPDSKSFTENILWPDEETGFVSLYTPRHYSFKYKSKKDLRPAGVNRIHTRSLWGACALVWPREVLEIVVEHDIAKKWLGAPTRTKSPKIKQKRMENPELIQNSDTAIGKIMNKMKRKMFFVDPSPVEHISKFSAINHGTNTGKRNCYRCAEWDTPLEGQVWAGFDPVKIKI